MATAAAGCAARTSCGSACPAPAVQRSTHACTSNHASYVRTCPLMVFMSACMKVNWPSCYLPPKSSCCRVPGSYSEVSWPQLASQHSTLYHRMESTISAEPFRFGPGPDLGATTAAAHRSADMDTGRQTGTRRRERGIARPPRPGALQLGPSDQINSFLLTTARLWAQCCYASGPPDAWSAALCRSHACRHHILLPRALAPVRCCRQATHLTQPATCTHTSWLLHMCRSILESARQVCTCSTA